MESGTDGTYRRQVGGLWSAIGRYDGRHPARRRADADAAAALYNAPTAPFVLRDVGQVEAFFQGREQVAADVVAAHLWHLDRRPGPAIPVLANVTRREGSPDIGWAQESR